MHAERGPSYAVDPATNASQSFGVAGSRLSAASLWKAASICVGAHRLCAAKIIRPARSAPTSNVLHSARNAFERQAARIGRLDEVKRPDVHRTTS